jgi:hypothetical protein
MKVLEEQLVSQQLLEVSTIKQLSFLTKFSWLLKLISIIFVLIAMALVSSAEEEKLIATYNSNPSKVADEVKQALSDKNYNLALVRVEKYLKVLPNNPELKLLQQEAEALKTQVQKEKAKNTEQKSTSSIKIESDPDMVGRCFGIIGQVIQTQGIQALTPGNQKYIQAHSDARDIIVKMGNETASCLKPGTPMDSCLGSYSAYEVALFKGVNTGTTAYSEARRFSPEKTAVYQMACSEN